MTYEEYRSRPEVSASDLRLVLRAPALLRHMREHPEDNDTPAKKFGRLAHLAILEPAVYDEDVIVAPDGIDRRTKEGKAQWAEFELRAAGREIAKAEDDKAIRSMRAAVLAHPEAASLVAQSDHEVTSIDSEKRRKGRADMVHRDGEWIADLKTCEDASPDAMARAVASNLYHLQAAWYLDLWGVDGFFIVAVEKKAPYLVAVYELDEATIEKGRELYVNAERIYRECEKENIWPGYPSTAQLLRLPAWAF